MTHGKLNIAVIGDRFITPELVAELIARHVEPVTGPCAVASMILGWPEDTPVHDDEIQEYVGDPSAIATFAAEANVVVTQVAPIGQHLIEGAPGLQLIACARGGPVSVNLSAATRRGIPVLYAPGANAQAVAEFTLGLLLAVSKQIARSHHALVAGEWQVDAYHYARAPRELRGQTAGLVGFGHIGQLLVPYLHAFGLRVLVYDPYVPAEQCAALGVEPVDLPLLLAESDFVSLHARVTAETRGLMGAPEFAQMKPGAYLINTARGPLVDYEALYATLASGHLGGAALDTFALEPPPAEWPLLKLDNVTVTPHIAGSSRETARRKVETVLLDVANYYAGRPLVHCANPAALARSRRENTP
jgi:D-3-phosphoglycerate dehydrogenase